METFLYIIHVVIVIICTIVVFDKGIEVVKAIRAKDAGWIKASLLFFALVLILYYILFIK